LNSFLRNHNLGKRKSRLVKKIQLPSITTWCREERELSKLNLIAVAINKESGIGDNDYSSVKHIAGMKHKGYY